MAGQREAAFVYKSSDFRTSGLAEGAVRNYADLRGGYRRRFSVQGPTLLPPSDTLAAAAGPSHRCCPHPSNPLLRRRALTPSPRPSANRRLMEPRETGRHCALLNREQG